jgi:hypothetical protein
MMTRHDRIKEDPCTMELWPLEAQRLLQRAQQFAHFAKTSPLGGMASSFRVFFFM